MEQYLKQFEDCRQWEKPFCTAACPFNVDILDFQEKMARNSYNAAFRTFRNAVGFPDIVAALCKEYCASSCPRADVDKAVQLNLLEKTCVSKATKKDPIDYNVPVKNRRIGIIGAGISGLACALRLSSKKYDVTIYEKDDRIGGQLWGLLPPEIFLEDIKRQFQFEDYTLHLNTEVKSISEIKDQGFEAIYVATGKNGLDFGVMDSKTGHCDIIDGIAIFAGGSLTGKDLMHSLADGLNMSLAIETYLKTDRLEYPKSKTTTKTVVDPDKLKQTEPISPTDNGIFTDEEVKLEADRCIRCQCDACREYCDLCSFYNRWPLKIRDEVMATISPSESMIHATPAIRLINTCTQCKLCDTICPSNIELGDMIHEAKRRLHNLGKMPGAFHQFWLNDMKFANDKFAALRKKAPMQEQCTYAFFPGCQLGATDPNYVIESYSWLLSKEPKTGLLLRCCGVPADWAGNEDMHKQEIEDIKKEWEALDKPILILACPTCSKNFKEFLPEIETISLYEIMVKWNQDWEKKDYKQTYSIFDPCSVRDINSIQQAVRDLAEQSGISLEELPKGDKHGCCGYGGQSSIANPDFTDYVSKKRAELSENPYITYCINCRDVFIGEKKPVLHILDILFDINKLDSELPNMSERRYNRTDLKERLLKEFWGEEMKERPKEDKFDLIISKEIQEKMDSLKILKEDISDVLELSIALGHQIFNKEKGTYICFRELGYITYWVEYRPVGEKYEIINVYTHRIKIELEMMWNGKKTDFDLR